MNWRLIHHQLLEKVIVNEDGENKEALLFRDGQAYILERTEALEVIEKLRLFYEHSNNETVDSYIEKNNINSRVINYGIDFPLNENTNKYQIPKPNNFINAKRFRKDLKRQWSFTCSWCGNKVSSKEDLNKQYYTLGGLPYNILVDSEIYDDSFIRGCSKACAESLVKDYFKRWIHEKGYKKYFEV